MPPAADLANGTTGETSFSSETFFETQDPPAKLEQTLSVVRSFIRKHAAARRKVVLVTPFSRHYSHSTNPFLSLLDVSTEAPKADDRTAKPSPHPYIHVKPAEQARMVTVLQAYQRVQAMDLLHSLPFVTVFDYLFLLRGIAHLMSERLDGGYSVGQSGMYYLAAAVSDFFIPQQKMSEHKIQSGKGALVIEMDQVPKILRSLVQEWSAGGFIVSFKLETDRKLIVPKARVALERYGHQIVVGNDLHTRKQEVVFVQRDSEEWLRMSDEQLASGDEIEAEIVKRLISMHNVHISHSPQDVA
ncbi:Phosphopantothenate--cysteine ligase cab2 [Cystobasidiomycetes sp. EMM_F5]